MSLAENVVILMRYAAIREINLNTEVQKPSIAEVLQFKGPRMDCADESTPHEETRIYSSIYEGGNVMQKFEESNARGSQNADEQRDRPYPVRSEGRYGTPTNPWPRDPEKESRDMTSVQKRKPYTHRRQAHIVSDQVTSKSTWGPCEPAVRDKRLAQPYHFNRPIKVMVNGPDGQAISDSRSRTNGVAVLPDGTRLPAMSTLGGRHQFGKGQSGLPQLEGP